MGYEKNSLRDKIYEIYPELHEHGVKMRLHLDKDKDSWVVSLEKDKHHLETFLDRSDANACIDGKVCVPLGVKIGEFLDNFRR